MGCCHISFKTENKLGIINDKEISDPIIDLRERINQEIPQLMNISEKDLAIITKEERNDIIQKQITIKIPDNEKEKYIEESPETIKIEIDQKDFKEKKDDLNQLPTLNSDKGENLKNLNDNKYPNEINENNSPLNKVKVGLEIFVKINTAKISEQYTPGQVLGQGSFGLVRLVTHKSTGMIRAMKVLKKENLIKEEEKKLFAELDILKNLDHPHIVKLFELFQDNENYYLITEYCSGGELFDRLKSFNYLSEKIAAEIMRQILLAVVYCHSQNIVHRDLKPENILFESLKPDSNLKVIDFGTSRKFNTNSRMKKTLGTPYYIAPEVLKQEYNEKCDIWSLGVVLYMLLCGYVPFSGATPDEVFYKVKLGKFEFPESDWSNISGEAKDLIRSMLKYDFTKRISAEEALNHNWISKNTKTDPLNQKVITTLVNFNNTNKIQVAIYTFIVSQLTPSAEKEELKKCFQNLDKNGDGKLSVEELIEAYTQIYNNKNEAIFLVSKIIRNADSNFSGKIDYTEFLVAATNREKLLAKHKVHQAFKLFDMDGNGFITQDELKKIMGSDIVSEEIWKEILGVCDVNKDGKISELEFINFLSSYKDK